MMKLLLVIRRIKLIVMKKYTKGNNYSKHDEHCLTNAHPTVMLNLKSHSKHCSCKDEPDCDALAFPKKLI